MSVNISNISRHPINADILSALDIVSEGKVVRADDWKRLWTLVFQYINSFSNDIATFETLKTDWQQAVQSLNATVNDFNIKYDALAKGFVHYGAQAPSNPSIRFWVQPTDEVDSNTFVTRAELRAALESLQPSGYIDQRLTTIETTLSELETLLGGI